MSNERPSNGREQWSRNIFFVFACVGAAVGLGNLWRFPYMAYENGGAAFLIPYLICLLVVGIPLALLEIGLGRWGGGSIAAAYHKRSSGMTWIGWWVLINSMVIVFYYCVVLSWCVQYFVFSFTEAWGSDAAGFFTGQVMHLTNSPMELGGLNWGTVAALAVIWAAVFFIVSAGTKGLSRVLLITVPLPLIILLVLAFRSVGLPGAGEGVQYLLNPRFGEILSFGVWGAAASQVVLSLGLGMGQMVAYASRKADDSALAKSAVSICSLDVLFSLLAGIITFAMMGVLAHSQGVALTELKLDGLFLAFVSYPMAISTLPLAPLWGILFFLLLISLGIDSAFAVIEATLTGSKEMSPRTNRRKLALILCAFGFVGGIFFATGGGLYWLDIVDHWVEKYAIASLIVLEVLIFGSSKKVSEISARIKSSWPAFPAVVWQNVMRWVVPIILLLAFGGRIVQEGVKDLMGYSGYPLTAIIIGGWGVLFAIVAVAITVGRFYNNQQSKG